MQKVANEVTLMSFSRLYDMIRLFCITSLLLSLRPNANAQLKAFPGAEGFGAYTRGAWSGNDPPDIYHVTTLSDDDTMGTFRSAFKTNRPVVVIFDTAGTITLTEDVFVAYPYVTIAGQTAPGDGICLKGKALRICASDVIVRGLRIRNGTPSQKSEYKHLNEDCLFIDGSYWGHTVSNVIIDHCSLSWASDEICGTYADTDHITFQYNIISEGLNSESNGFGALICDQSTHISMHHNLFALNRMRNPELSDGSSGELINNVIYGWSNKGTDATGGDSFGRNTMFWNIGNNYFKNCAGWRNNPITMYQPYGYDNYYFPTGSSFYIHDNYYANNGLIQDWDLVYWNGETEYESYMATSSVIASSGYIEEPLTPNPKDLLERVLMNVGAAPRDPRDTLVIQSVRNGTGNIITNCPSYPILTGTPHQDTDHDGIPDDWEITHGLNPADSSDYTNTSSNGYTLLEEYMNNLIQMKPSISIIAHPMQNGSITLNWNTDKTIAESSPCVIEYSDNTVTWHLLNHAVFRDHTYTKTTKTSAKTQFYRLRLTTTSN